MNSILHSGGVPGGTAGTGDHQSPFRKFSSHTASAMGSPWAFVAAVGSIALWAILGPHFHFSDTWQLVINTTTSVITFLMVFLIQNTQNRDARAIQLKLDELIRAREGARNSLIDLENCSEADIAKLEAEFRLIREKNHPNLKSVT